MSNTPPKISIIIPTFREGKVLERTLAQFSQELRNDFHLEIIISDRGSDDETIPIARKYADIVIVATPGEQQNIAIGRNRGAEKASGSILLFLDADVLIDEPQQFFLKMVRNLKIEGVVAATCNVRIYHEEEIAIDKAFHGFFNWWFWLMNNIGFGMGRGECQMIKKDAFIEKGGYNGSFAAGEDFELFNRLKTSGIIVFDSNLIVRESPRRYRRYGYSKVTWMWFQNALSMLFLKKSYHKVWESVR